ncbi:hypothetical protein GCM10011581_33860 [Saccharopolyspora subtropica]|uniref:Uncharacterized protein n=1 Tax=Saccharopolyspora thermophila TaxID=89367 RepID=A0A917NEV3_9PSEU|nr:hypothetical protein [Saccharopolyspora subtropica]GGI93950.1 hypothetical protein GCM10011581_33860 [Saccharopolyspora subtropica]
MDYARLPAIVQFALVDVEVHTHLARVEQASRMWRTIAAELREVSDSLRHELDRLQQHWKDATGVEFIRRAAGRRAAIDELLERIEEHRPWLALDDLARQLVICQARITGAVERSADASHQEAAADLEELDRYFHAAAEAVLAAAGVSLAANGPLADGCCSGPGVTGPVLAGGLGPNLAPHVALDSGSGSMLPPGSVSIPGLLAVPSSAGGRYTPRGGAGGSPAEPRSTAGAPIDASSSGPRTTAGGSLPDASSPDIPRRIEQVANPVPLTGPPAAPEAPQPPERPTGTAPGTKAASAGMVPPMMMPPMIPGTGGPATGRRSGATRSLDGARRTRTTTAVPGVPSRLRGRSALADPVGSGYRPVAMSGTRNTANEPAQQALDHEVWQVANPGAASPVKPEVVQTEQPRRLRRPRH